jgi:glyoxylase-like metal-dependent hydrolase (beta-lactamase superfamily II)/rhodanese-related sulfurtransferase
MEKLENSQQVPEMAIAELLTKIDAGEPLLLLDVRNDDEFESWKLEGRRPIDTMHVPYFEFIENEASSIAHIPKDREVVVVCARGGSSEMVAEMLRDAGIAAQNVAGGMVAYGEYLQPVQVPLRADEAGRFEIWQINRRGKGCLSYVIRSRDEAIVVDPSRHVEQYQAFVRRLGARIVRVLDTHVHADHVSGGPALAALNNVPYCVAAEKGFDLRQNVQPLVDGEEIRLGGDAEGRVVIQAVATPGHTPGSTSYLIAGRYLLSGDTIFVRNIGRPDLGGQVVEWGKALFRTLRERLASLSDDTVVLPGHYAEVSEIGPDGVVSARLGDLRRTVPELQIRSEREFVEAMQAAVSSPPESYAHIIGMNLGQTSVEAEKATEWELGKNQCAASAGPTRP